MSFNSFIITQMTFQTITIFLFSITLALFVESSYFSNFKEESFFPSKLYINICPYPSFLLALFLQEAEKHRLLPAPQYM